MGLCLVFGLQQGVWAGDDAAAPRPNIVLIMSDDMGFSDIGCYGGEIDTPTLDRLAANGVRFSQFYNTGRCCPTRASLLTGLYPHQAGVGWMMADRGYPGYRGDLNRECVTIAEVLHRAGYATYMTGKWHVTKHIQPDGPKFNWPRQRGFERFYGTITGAGSFFDPGTLCRDNTNISPFADPEYRPKVFYYTDAIGDHAARFITEHERATPDRPYFLYVAFTAAHWPMHALPEDIEKYKGRYSNGYRPIREARFRRLKELGLIRPDWELSPQHGDWESFPHKEWEARCMEVYAAMIDRMDRNIGKIVEAIEQAGDLQNTLILFLQDNGGCQEGVGRKGNWKRPVAATLPKIPPEAIRLDVIPKQNRAGVPTLQGPHIMPGPEDTYIAYGINWANVSNTPFREYKHFVHEGGISTPLIAHWPAGIRRKGAIEHQPGHLIDIMATCVDVAGAEYPETYMGHRIQPMEGVSLVPAFNGEPLRRSEPLFWEHEGNRAVRDGKWKLVAKENRPWELYDMERDRTEMHDLSGEHPEIVQRLSAAWDRWARRARVLPLGAWRGKPKAKKPARRRSAKAAKAG
ncbi:MAG: arylsulfatase [Planctomycetota bacterium]|nr:MAG: arylsulfatase [Planctomycetota bacterium]